MKPRFTERVDKDYAGLPAGFRKAFAKQLRRGGAAGAGLPCCNPARRAATTC
jgi:hypothetical protein